MNVKITLAITICVVALLCMTTPTECIKHMGQATEKTDQKAPDDGLVSAYSGSKIVKRSLDFVLRNSRNPDMEVWHNEPPILLNRPEEDEYLDRKIRPAPY